ncbi:hypothetical protein C8J56DRAFT_930387 [Mycena floridula]|nr:hypothetical protein C8J56DRAFT_930387 [Mycena floridula]
MAISHRLRQLKLIIPGALATYYLGTVSIFWRVFYEHDDAWARKAAYGGLALGFTTVALFIYVLLTPWLLGQEPDFRSWRQSGTLSSVIPALTSSIVVGWLLLVFVYGQYTDLGYLKGIVGVSAAYALVFGILALIPAPRLRRQ